MVLCTFLLVTVGIYRKSQPCSILNYANSQAIVFKLGCKMMSRIE